MKKIATLVEEIIKGDEIALEAHRLGYLNLSAYAKKIAPLIANQTLLQPSKNAIVTALSRMKESLMHAPPLRPSIKIQDLSIKAPLCELTYEKTQAVIRNTTLLSEMLKTKENFFSITYGVNEVTIIAPTTQEKYIATTLKQKPKAVYTHLAAITVKFKEEEYIEVPNMIYAFLSTLASKRINVIEIVSTFSEISVLVREHELQQTVDVLKGFFN